MHSCQYIEENRYFSNGGTNLHIHAIAQGRPEDNQVEFLQGPHWIVNPPKNLVLNNIRRFTQMANGLVVDVWNSLPDDVVTAPSLNMLKRRLDYHWRNETFLYNYKAPVTHAHATGRANTLSGT